MNKKLYLASASPRRKELLMGLGADITIVKTDAEEKIDVNLPPHILVQELALLKGSAAASGLQDGLVISADTIVELDGILMGKPKDKTDAARMLKSLSGRSHNVHTAVTVLTKEKSISKTVTTKVHFRKLTDKEISDYIYTGEPMDKAGAYGIQGRASKFVSGIEGDYFNVVGLPVCTLSLMLKEFDIN